ncbi:hypothetical protein HLI03_10015 [Rhizobium laguerreae]|jgi:hypothetical protein|uniref:hypothetical protein n=1 Tax=Rhizobium laguerreae TaxID=1076926 RepID=UPI001389563C|nr:hypothetical protein [Rhizobium laguerreae]NDK54014.1 hypothetical protein [Rhizobium laguerreae]NNH42011.1 hypothetical protein [Rhizobium laguerreae]NNH57221.1 hypothetical protein [Rhizobium laguerreae]
MSETSKTITAAIIQRDTYKRLGHRLQALPELALPMNVEGVFVDLLKKLDAVAAGNPVARLNDESGLLTCVQAGATI